MAEPNFFQESAEEVSDIVFQKQDFCQDMKDSEIEYINTPTDYSDHSQSSTISLGPLIMRYTLVLDLDNTLVSTLPICELGVNGCKPKVNYEIRVRPYAHELLESASRLFEIIVFTAGTEDYAQIVVNILDPQRVYINRVLSRASCVHSKEGQLIKDLTIIKDRDINNMVIVDDSPISYSLQPNNGIPVTPYYGEEDDEELRYLADYLEELASSEDIIPYNQMRIHAMSHK
jgi:CTD small phosphatase-like protein 2